MKRHLIALLSGLIGTLAAAPADAKLLDIYANVKGGYVTGQGLNELPKENTTTGEPIAKELDYFELEKGPTLGFELGVEVLLLDFSITGYQFFKDGSTAGTLFEGLVGMDVDIPLDGGRDPRLFLRLGANAGIAFGLHRKLDPPLDKAEVADFGFVAHAIGGLQYFLTDSVFLGAEFLPGYHYFVPGGDGTVNEASQGLQYMAFLTTGFHFEPFSGDDSGDRSGRKYRPYRPQPQAPPGAAPARPTR